MSSERFFLGVRKMRKVSKNQPAVVIGIPPAYLTDLGIDIKKIHFNLYVDMKTKDLIISPPKTIEPTDEEYGEVVEKANFQDVMNDSATEELQDMLEEQDHHVEEIKI